ncbi:IS110 family transposase [Rhodococcus sp. ARC_M6]|uniref:IS110 family transposase n=1 Tax=Rhodococcus sp. ARC_M6 TaxID=2928852 RepID=UPI001FB228B7|nr:IS110 family transposase [Rhodococcus sp. ARC_M6]MCJ0907229.1 IS110 family transposase [Rhodococcus sp. ARC_M6]
MQKSSAVAGIDWATELHAVCVLGNDGRMIERFDVTHDSQALHVMVSKFRKAGVTKVAIERGDGPVAEGIDRCGVRGVRCPVAPDQGPTDPLRIGGEQG